MAHPSPSTHTSVITAAAAPAVPALSVENLLARLKHPDEQVNTAACASAEACGAGAILPLAALLGDPDFELARRAKRALARIVHRAGRPGQPKQAAAVEARLILLLKDPSAAVRRYTLWLLSEIGTNKAVTPMAALLADKEVAEDARCALLRLPGKRPVAALRSAFETASGEFKFALADALRRRGQKVDGYPTGKMRPAAATAVLPLRSKQGAIPQ